MTTPWIMQKTDPGDPDIEYTAAMIRRLTTQLLWNEGVVDLTAFKITQRAVGATMSVDYAAGVAYVDGDDAASQGTYACELDADNETVSAVPGANSRYDLVVLQVNDPQAGGGAGSNCEVKVIAGTPSASPAVPATPSSAIALARLGPITPSTTSITTSLITDLRTIAGRRCEVATIEIRADEVVPNGWLGCDGSAVSRSTYARLFAHIGTSYGAGNGTTTFNVPDFRGRVVVPKKSGQTQVDTVGETGGDYNLQSHVHTGPSHTHTGPSHTHSIDHDHPSAGVTSTLLAYPGEIGNGSPPSGLRYTTTGSGTAVNPGPFMSVDLPNYTGTSGASGTAATGASGTGDTGSTGTGSGQNMPPYQVAGLAVIRT